MKLVKMFLLFCGTTRLEQRKTGNTTIVKRYNFLTMVVALAVMALSLPNAAEAVAVYTEQDILSDVVNPLLGVPVVVDPDFKTPWGVTYSTTGRFRGSDNLPHGAALYSGTFSSTPISITPLAVSVVGSPIGGVFDLTLVDFVIASGGTSAPAIFNSTNLNGAIEGWTPHVPPPPPQKESLLGSIRLFHTSSAGPRSLLLVLSGVAMVVAARHRLRR